jgi:hypothetical protein
VRAERNSGSDRQITGVNVMSESIKPVFFSNVVILAVALGLQWASLPGWINTVLYTVAMWVGLSTVKLVWYTWKWKLE